MGPCHVRVYPDSALLDDPAGAAVENLLHLLGGGYLFSDFAAQANGSMRQR